MPCRERLCRNHVGQRCEFVTLRAVCASYRCACASRGQGAGFNDAGAGGRVVHQCLDVLIRRGLMVAVGRDWRSDFFIHQRCGRRHSLPIFLFLSWRGGVLVVAEQGFRLIP